MLTQSCSDNREYGEDKLPGLFSQPISVILNTNTGYATNQLTGVDVEDLNDFYGAPLKTGVPISANGRVVYGDSVAQPRIFKVGSSIPLVFDKSSKSAIYQPVKIEVNSTNIKESKLTIKESSYVLSARGDTVRTGVSIPAPSTNISISEPPLIKQLPHSGKDGASYDIRIFGTDQGLASAKLKDLLIDQDGHVWFTSQSGVTVFDGVYFKNYNAEIGFPEDYIYCIFQDSKGVFWIGDSDAGLFRFDGKSLQKIDLGSKHLTIKNISEDQQHKLWLNTQYLGLICYDGVNRIHYTKNEGFNAGSNQTTFIDSKGNVWIGGYKAPLTKFNGETISRYEAGSIDGEQLINAIHEDIKGNIWFGTRRKGIVKYDGFSFFHYEEMDGQLGLRINSISEDNTGTLWIGTENGGVFKFKDEKFTQISLKEGLSHPMVGDARKDEDGNVWITTSGGGLNCYRPSSFTYQLEESKFSDTEIYSIFEDSRGFVWYGTNGKGVLRFDGHEYVHFSSESGFPSIVWSIMEDSNGNIWFGSQGDGVFCYNGSTMKQITEESGLINNVIFDILEDRTGRIWFGTNNGLCAYDGRNFMHFDLTNGLSDQYILTLMEDHKGDIWFGSFKGGVSKYDGQSFTHFTEKEGLSNNTVWTILQDSDKNYWFGTLKGLNKFDGQNFTYYTKKQGLLENSVVALVEDKKKRLWIASDNGLHFMEQKELEGEYVSITQFGKNDGLKTMDFSRIGLLLDSKNHLQMGTRAHLTELNLNTYNKTNEPPRLELKSIALNEQFYDFKAKIADSLGIAYSGVSFFNNYPKDLELPYFRNHLTFYFCATDWSSPHKVRYSYRIKELNTTWSTPSSEAKAECRNLPYGNFTLEIIAIGESGVWSDPLRYAFKVNPPWWHTWTARLVYVIFGLLLVLFIIQRRTAKLRARQIELEKEIEIATAEIRKEKDRSEELLLNILPEEIAEELKATGSAEAQLIDLVTVLFTDFKGFTALSETLSPKELVKEINICFSAFDHIMEKYNVEKIKTIGDAYMAAGGLPTANRTHAIDVVKAAIDIQEFMLKHTEEKKAKNKPYFEIRIGIHTGPVVAGIVGVKKFQYDIWGDTVNTASRMESSGEVGKVNISESTYDIIKECKEYTFRSRGKIEAKGKGMLEMFFVERK